MVSPLEVEILRVERAIQQSWCRETSIAPEIWTPDRSYLGQSFASAFVLDDYTPGEIIVRYLNPDRRAHYMNIINGDLVDVAYGEVPKNDPYMVAPHDFLVYLNCECLNLREHTFTCNPEFLTQYQLLRSLVEEKMGAPHS